MNSFISFLWSGFGTGVTAFRAMGILLICLLFGVIAAYYVIRFIVRLITRLINKGDVEVQTN